MRKVSELIDLICKSTKKTSDFFVKTLCLVLFISLFVGADDCDDGLGGCDESDFCDVYTKITFVNNSNIATHLYLNKKDASPAPGNKVEPGSSRQQSFNESVLYSSDRRENGYTITVVVIAARNGEMISNHDFTLKDYEKREDAKGKVSFHGSFTLSYPW